MTTAKKTFGNRKFYSLPEDYALRAVKTRPGQAAKKPEETAKLLKYIDDSVIGKNATFASPFGRRKVVYCDYTASGRSLQFLEDYILREVLPSYGNTHTTTSITSLQSTLFRHEARDIFRNAVNASEHDAVIFAGHGCTGAVHKLVNALNLTAPAVVFVGPSEHHSNLLPWREQGATIVRISESREGVLDLVDLELQLQTYHGQGCQLIGCFSAASNITGILADDVTTTVLLHKYGALAFWDYAAAAPYVKIDMNPILPNIDERSVSKDAIFFSVHKFVGGVQTPGVLIAKKALFRNTVPNGCGGGTVFFVSRDSHRYLQDTELREEGGTAAVVESVRAGLVMQLKEAVGVQAIMAREEKITRMMLAHARTIPELILLGPSSGSAKRLPIFSFMIRHPRGSFLHHNFVCMVLNDVFGIQARGGCACAGPYAQDLLGIDPELAQEYENVLLEDSRLDRTHLRRHEEHSSYEMLRPGFARISLPFFMPDAEVAFVLEALKMVATEAWKLLPQYIVNPETGEWRHHTNLTFKERKWLGAVRYIDGKMSVNERRVSGAGTFPPDYAECLRTARGVCSRARKMAQRCPLADQKVMFDGVTERLRWFMLPSEAQDLLLGNSQNVKHVVPFDPCAPPSSPKPPPQPLTPPAQNANQFMTNGNLQSPFVNQAGENCTLPAQTYVDQAVENCTLPAQTVVNQAVENCTLPAQTYVNQAVENCTLPAQTYVNQAGENCTLPAQTFVNLAGENCTLTTQTYVNLAGENCTLPAQTFVNLAGENCTLPAQTFVNLAGENCTLTTQTYVDQVGENCILTTQTYVNKCVDNGTLPMQSYVNQCVENSTLPMPSYVNQCVENSTLPMPLYVNQCVETCAPSTPRYLNGELTRSLSQSPVHFAVGDIVNVSSAQSHVLRGARGRCYSLGSDVFSLPGDMQLLSLSVDEGTLRDSSSQTDLKGTDQSIGMSAVGTPNAPSSSSIEDYINDSSSEGLTAYVREMTKDIATEIKSEIREVISQVEDVLSESMDNVDMYCHSNPAVIADKTSVAKERCGSVSVSDVMEYLMECSREMASEVKSEIRSAVDVFTFPETEHMFPHNKNTDVAQSSECSSEETVINVASLEAKTDDTDTEDSQVSCVEHKQCALMRSAINSVSSQDSGINLMFQDSDNLFATGGDDRPRRRRKVNLSASTAPYGDEVDNVDGETTSAMATTGIACARWYCPPKAIWKPAVEALHEFNMIRDGDRVMVCLSGGKDSLSLLHLLHQFQFYAQSKGVQFTLGAATVDPGSTAYDPRPLIPYLASLGVHYLYEEQPILEQAAALPESCTSVCSFCSRMKRGRLYAAARANGYNVLALGQHLDDLVESFFMSAFHNGRLRSMKAHYSIRERDLRVIRPLVYVREKALRQFAESKGLPVIAENCPACFEAPKERFRSKQLLAQQEILFPRLFWSLRTALHPLICFRNTGEEALQFSRQHRASRAQAMPDVQVASDTDEEEV